MLINYIYRTLVYIEGDASVRVYEDAEGKRQSSLNIVQRLSTRYPLTCP